MELRPGLKGSAELVVGDEHTAPSIGSGKVRVLATPVMINLIEAAALDAIERLLPAGYQSLGTHLDVRHIAATPVGMKVTAKATLLETDGKRFLFAVEAWNEVEKIAEGRHERYFTADLNKLLERAMRKGRT